MQAAQQTARPGFVCLDSFVDSQANETEQNKTKRNKTKIRLGSDGIATRHCTTESARVEKVENKRNDALSGDCLVASTREPPAG